MKRILISQNEKNDGIDYVVANGELIKDEDLCLQYYRQLRESDTWKQNYKDDFLELKSSTSQILLKSHYLDKDDVNRNIYYTYLIENKEDFNSILDSLEKDSEIIKRKIDREKTREVVTRIKTNKKLKLNINKILMALAAIGIAYFIINSLRS